MTLLSSVLKSIPEPPQKEPREVDRKTKIRFQGRDFLLIGSVEKGGAIATREQFDNFIVSYAYLNPDGKIVRYNQQIGTIEDLEFFDTPTTNPV